METVPGKACPLELSWANRGWVNARVRARRSEVRAGLVRLKGVLLRALWRIEADSGGDDKQRGVAQRGFS